MPLLLPHVSRECLADVVLGLDRSSGLVLQVGWRWCSMCLSCGCVVCADGHSWAWTARSGGLVLQVGVANVG